MHGAGSVRQRTDPAPQARKARMSVYGDIEKQLLKDSINRKFEIIDQDMSLAEKARHMRDGDFGLLPVCENDRMDYTTSHHDITIRAGAAGKDTATKVCAVMSAGLNWTYEGDAVEQAVKVMSEWQICLLAILNCAMVHARRRSAPVPMAVPPPEVPWSDL
jgi:predicted transcriptional regulator